MSLPALLKNKQKWIATIICIAIIFSLVPLHPAFSNNDQNTNTTNNQNTNTTSNQNTNTTPSSNSIQSEQEPGWFEKVGLYVVNFFLSAIQKAISWFLTTGASMLDVGMEANVNVTPESLSAVMIGWTILRDLANAILLLIILWVAFTIIFNLEQWGGMKLFFKVLIIAIFINFSMALVSFTFGITNRIAGVFRENMPKDVSVFITNRTKTFSVAQPTGTEEAAKLEASAQRDKATALLNPPKPTPLGTAILASIGVKSTLAESNQQLCDTLKSCGQTAKYSEASAAIAKQRAQGTHSKYDETYSLIVGIILLTAAACTVIIGGVALFIRFIAMIFLSVLSPFAFAAMAIPGSFTQNIWKKWSFALINHAVFAPIFYFLFYLSLVFLNNISHIKGVSALNDPNAILGIFFTLGLMAGAAKIAKKASGGVTDAVLSGASKIAGFGVGLATGGAGFALKGASAVGGAAIGAAVRREGVREKLVTTAEKKVIGKLTAPITRGLISKYERDKREIEEERRRMAGMSDEAAKIYAATSIPGLNLKKRLGRNLDLANRNLLSDDQIEKWLPHAQHYGFQLELLKNSPHLARAEHFKSDPSVKDNLDAMAKVLKEGVKNPAKVNKSVYMRGPDGKPKHPEAMEALILNLNPTNMKIITEQNPALMTSITQFIKKDISVEELKRLISRMDKKQVDYINKFLDGTLGGKIGLAWAEDGVKTKWLDAQPGAKEKMEAKGREKEKKELEDKLDGLKKELSGIREAITVSPDPELSKKEEEIKNKIKELEEKLVKLGT